MSGAQRTPPDRTPSHRTASDRTESDWGAGTVLTIVLAPIALIGIAMLWVFVDLATLRTRAAGAADLAALAAAAHLPTDPNSACAVAADVARRNEATLEACRVDGVDVVVTVAVASSGIAARMASWVGVDLPPVRQQARAGSAG